MDVNINFRNSHGRLLLSNGYVLNAFQLDYTLNQRQIQVLHAD